MAIKIVKFEPEIGDTINITYRNHFSIDAICIEVEDNDEKLERCQYCILDEFLNLCDRCKCCKENRKDKKSIMFKMVDDDNKG